MSNSPSILHKFRIFLVAWILAALSLMISPSSAMADAADPWGDLSSEDYYVIVSAWDGVNIREFPGIKYKKLSFASQGTRLHVIASAKNENGKPWLKIESPSGWAAASEVTNERYYQPPARATTKSTPPAPATTPVQTPTETVTTTVKTTASDNSEPQVAVSKGLMIALVAIVAIVCIIAIVLLYLLFVKGKKNPPAYPGTPW